MRHIHLDPLGGIAGDMFVYSDPVDTGERLARFEARYQIRIGDEGLAECHGT